MLEARETLLSSVLSSCYIAEEEGRSQSGKESDKKEDGY